MKMSGYFSSKPAGFTIIEIVLVLGVGMIMMAIAIPNLVAVLPGFRLSDGARQVAKDLQVARMKAIAQNRKFRLNFVSSSSYTVQSDQNGDGTIASTENESGPFSLPKGITATPLGATSEVRQIFTNQLLRVRWERDSLSARSSACSTLPTPFWTLPSTCFALPLAC